MEAFTRFSASGAELPWVVSPWLRYRLWVPIYRHRWEGWTPSSASGAELPPATSPRLGAERGSRVLGFRRRAAVGKAPWTITRFSAGRRAAVGKQVTFSVPRPTVLGSRSGLRCRLWVPIYRHRLPSNDLHKSSAGRRAVFVIASVLGFGRRAAFIRASGRRATSSGPGLVLGYKHRATMKVLSWLVVGSGCRSTVGKRGGDVLGSNRRGWVIGWAPSCRGKRGDVLGFRRRAANGLSSAGRRAAFAICPRLRAPSCLRHCVLSSAGRRAPIRSVLSQVLSYLRSRSICHRPHRARCRL